uniref:U6 snRNA-associated Sm-like protein LSm4 n=1 Tax=Lutzomyia longipalpis TaxID=7200 RepID=A0A1B0CSM5_LUTLO
MLPLSLLKTAQSHPMLVELKNGETYNGHLVSCDTWMNINLREVICTSKDGDRFWRMPECYIRGSTIKYLRIPDEVIDMVKEDVQRKHFWLTNLTGLPAFLGNSGKIFVNPVNLWRIKMSEEVTKCLKQNAATQLAGRAVENDTILVFRTTDSPERENPDDGVWFEPLSQDTS